MSQSTTRTTRREATNGRVRTALEGAIKRPVKEAVHEALATGVQPANAAGEAGHETHIEQPTDTVDEAEIEADASTGTDADDAGNETTRSLPRRLLGSRRAVVFLAVVVGTYLRRRRRSNAGTE